MHLPYRNFIILLHCMYLNFLYNLYYRVFSQLFPAQIARLRARKGSDLLARFAALQTYLLKRLSARGKGTV